MRLIYRTKALFAALAVGLLPLLPAAVRATGPYTHELLLAGMISDGRGVLSDNGQWAVAGTLLPEAVVVIVNGQRLPTLIDGVKPSVPLGINDRGDWLVQGLWKCVDDWGCWDRMIKNGEVLDHGWSSDFWWGSGHGYLSKSGKAVWTNYSWSHPLRCVVVDGVNYSNQWSYGSDDYSVDVQSDGTPVWYGTQRGHSKIELWIGGDPVSRMYNLGEWDWRYAMSSQYRWVDVNDAGEVAWLGARRPGSVGYHVFKGDYDLTAAALGPAGWASNHVFLNERGQVLWKSGRYLYLDEQRAWFTEFLSWAGGIAVPYGLNDRGDVLWRRDPFSGGRWVYINDFNLTADLYGSNFITSHPLALNNAGQVLWSVNTLDGKWSIYLSTIVPEPSTALLLLPGVLLLGRRHTHRVRITPRPCRSAAPSYLPPMPVRVTPSMKYR